MDVGEGPQAATDDFLEAMYDRMAATLTDEQRADLLKMVEDYESKHGVTTKTTALKKKIEKTATDTEKETARVNANKAIDKALEDVDYMALQKKGSYTKSVKIGKEFYDVVVNSNGTATCNGVKKEFK